MFCANCGAPIQESDKFCPACGAVNEDYVESGAPEQAAPPEQTGFGCEEQPEQDAYGFEREAEKKVIGKGAVIGVAAAAAAVVILLVVGAILLFGGGAKAKVSAAATKSIKAYAGVVDAIGAPDLAKLYESKKVTQSVSVELRSVPGFYGEALKGLGVSYTAGCDYPGKKMDFSGALTYGSTELITAQALLKDSSLSVYVPELFDDTAYSLDTTTLGKDLGKLTDDMPDEYAKLSFNVFDALKDVEKDGKLTLNKGAAKDFAKAVKVEKAGSSSIDVNDHNVKCTQYHVVIPEDAILAYIDAVKDDVDAYGFDDKLIDALKSFGLPKDVIDEMKDQIKDSVQSSKEVFKSLKQLVKKVGDVELEVYLKGGYVMAAEWEKKIEGSKVALSLYLGGGKEYVDDLSLELRIDDDRFSVSSSGNHTAKGGTFTDTTTLRSRSSDAGFRSELEYSPKKSSDNFSWTVSGEGMGFTLKAEGQLNMSKNSLDLQLDKLSVADGSQEYALRLGWKVGPYDAQKLTAKKTTALPGMSKSELEELAEDIGKNAMRWSERMQDKHGDLFRYLNYMF